MPVPQRSMLRRCARWVAPLLLLGGCGPFGYLKKVSKDATRAVADAEAAGAEEYAPYEYWGALTYLEQARLLMGYSEYERSFDYGTRARQLAEEAKRKADMRESGTMVRALPSEEGRADAPRPEPDPGPSTASPPPAPRRGDPELAPDDQDDAYPDALEADGDREPLEEVQ